MEACTEWNRFQKNQWENESNGMEFEIDGKPYRVAMFRTARGNIRQTLDMNPMFFICVGELLGKIHMVRMQSARRLE